MQKCQYGEPLQASKIEFISCLVLNYYYYEGKVLLPKCHFEVGLKNGLFICK